MARHLGVSSVAVVVVGVGRGLLVYAGGKVDQSRTGESVQVN